HRPPANIQGQPSNLHAQHLALGFCVTKIDIELPSDRYCLLIERGIFHAHRDTGFLQFISGHGLFKGLASQDAVWDSFVSPVGATAGFGVIVDLGISRSENSRALTMLDYPPARVAPLTLVIFRRLIENCRKDVFVSL